MIAIPFIGISVDRYMSSHARSIGITDLKEMTKQEPYVLVLPRWFIGVLVVTVLPWSVWVTVSLLRLPREFPPSDYRATVVAKLDANAGRLDDMIDRLDRIEERLPK